MKKSKVKNQAEIHKPHTVRPEQFVITVALPETGTVKRYDTREDRPQTPRPQDTKRAARFLTAGLRRKKR